MNASLIEEGKFFGLFELDDAGTVLYSRAETRGGQPAEIQTNLVGRNFFREVTRFENAEELWQRIARFARNDVRADNFIFNCRIDSGSLAVRVLLARIGERTGGARTKSILVHIRKS